MFPSRINKGLFRPTPTVAAGGNGLLTDLKAYWKLDETSGNRADAHSGGHTLTDNSSVGYTTGKLNNAADFSGSNYLSKSSHADLVMGDIAWSFSLWTKVTSKSNYRVVFSKDPSGGSREYLLYYDVGEDRFRFVVYNSSEVGLSVVLTSTGAISTGSWYNLTGGWLPDDDSIWLCADNGTAASTYSAGFTPHSGTAPFEIGSYAAGSSPMVGHVDEIGLWKRALDATDRSNLYGSGTPPAYSTFD